MNCSDCDKEFNSASSLLQHFADHASKKILDNLDDAKPDKKPSIPDLHPIGMCPKIPPDGDAVHLDQSEETAAQISNNHETQKCPYCFKMFDWISALKKHVNSVHKEKKLLRCDECSLSFKRAVIFEEHIDNCHRRDDLKMRIPDLKPINRSWFLRKRHCKNFMNRNKLHDGFLKKTLQISSKSIYTK